MSARKRHLAFAPRAQRDIEHILAFTLDTWGKRQASAYQAKIDKALSVIADHPLRGRKTESGLHVMPVEKHRIFYRIDAKAVIVIRILHERMDESHHLA